MGTYHGNETRQASRRERALADAIRLLVADLRATDDLRHEALDEVRALRAEVYARAKAEGVSATMLRAAKSLTTA
jgi:hypothetical protein